MPGNSSDDKKVLAKATRTISRLVERSAVPAGLPYNDYRSYLRYDFYYSCAYCTMTEAEAQAVRMCIDHYNPVNNDPALANVYENLMYACDACNTLKGKRWPSQALQDKGAR